MKRKRKEGKIGEYSKGEEGRGEGEKGGGRKGKDEEGEEKKRGKRKKKRVLPSCSRLRSTVGMRFQGQASHAVSRDSLRGSRSASQPLFSPPLLFFSPSTFLLPLPLSFSSSTLLFFSPFLLCFLLPLHLSSCCDCGLRFMLEKPKEIGLLGF